MSLSDEQAIFISILENQRNVAMTELARIAARVAVLEQALAEANACKQESGSV
jgi:hypothetical protein